MLNIEGKDFNFFIDSLRNKKEAETGLIIGYKYNEKYYVYLISKTPQSEAKHKLVSVLLGLNLPTPDSVYSDWLLQHAVEVSRFLPGGVKILGIYSAAEEFLRLENFTAIPSCILKVCSDLSQEVTKDSNLLFFHYNAIESKYITGNLDIEVKRMQNKIFFPLEVKTMQMAKLEEIRSFYKMELEVSFEGTLQGLMQELLKTWNSMLESAVFVIDKVNSKEDVCIGAVKIVVFM